MKNKRNFIKKYWIRLTIIFLITTGLLMIIFHRHDNDEYNPKVCKEELCFIVELARTPDEQQK